MLPGLDTLDNGRGLESERVNDWKALFVNPAVQRYLLCIKEKVKYSERKGVGSVGHMLRPSSDAPLKPKNHTAPGYGEL